MVKVRVDYLPLQKHVTVYYSDTCSYNANFHLFCLFYLANCLIKTSLVMFSFLFLPLLLLPVVLLGELVGTLAISDLLSYCVSSVVLL